MNKPNPTASPTVADERGAAARLGVATGTLRNWRSQDRGPVYCHLGRRIIYRVRDIDAYLEANAVDPEANR